MSAARIIYQTSVGEGGGNDFTEGLNIAKDPVAIAVAGSEVSSEKENRKASRSVRNHLLGATSPVQYRSHA
jgi:hypothetical protein